MYLWPCCFDLPQRVCTRNGMMEEEDRAAITLTATDTVQLSISEKPLNSDSRGSCTDEAIEREIELHHTTDHKQ